ncbi:response regulator transcription factor [Proteiniclasticum sp. BAD-10]|uniref:Stage 0 sporulation protein A homolog n=1 Tax=Proteiniclasticum sediminis TaxID=2804028 RepID=A0A941CLJ4_9CLOT|nr:response regulator transcription factor [Proteiniclasticum sediminis]MBR0574837.1 response regulator transcription factor [Proteiniclasticum sediminis]
MKKQILIVEDEERLRKLLRDYLVKEEYTVDLAAHGEEGLAMALAKEYDLILLDVMMPFMDGFEVLKRLRKEKDTRVFFLTAKTMDEDFLTAYAIGADDYITKPFSPKILVLKLRALFQRLEQHARDPQVQTFGQISLSSLSQRVFLGEEELSLSKKEFELLELLATHEDIVLSRETIIEKVWGYDYEGDLRTIDTSIKRLREKLGPAAEYIETVRGFGYRFKVKDHD